MLLAIDRVKNPGGEPRQVRLRGFSWIVEPTPGGVVIAMEITSGAAVAGPFDIAQRRLDGLIARVLEARQGREPSSRPACTERCADNEKGQTRYEFARGFRTEIG